MSSQEKDPLADLLHGVTLAPADNTRREEIFARTRGVLQRRRVMRRAARVAALATCYMIGALSVLGWQAIRHQSQPTERQTVADAGPRGTTEKASETPSAPSQTPPTEEMAKTVTPSIPAESLTTFEKLRRAGDRQLNEKGNLQGAIGCYRRALDFASDDELRIVPERDSWLLIPLKEVRLETRKHAQKKI